MIKTFQSIKAGFSKHRDTETFGANIAACMILSLILTVIGGGELLQNFPHTNLNLPIVGVLTCAYVAGFMFSSMLIGRFGPHDLVDAKDACIDMKVFYLLCATCWPVTVVVGIAFCFACCMSFVVWSSYKLIQMSWKIPTTVALTILNAFTRFVMMWTPIVSQTSESAKTCDSRKRVEHPYREMPRCVTCGTIHKSPSSHSFVPVVKLVDGVSVDNLSGIPDVDWWLQERNSD